MMGTVTTPQVSVVVALVLGLAGLAWAIFTWRRSGPDIRAELGVGQVDGDGILSVYFASGENRINSTFKATVI